MDSSKRFKVILSTILILITLLLLYRFREILPMFILALFLAYILNPVVNWMSSKKIYKRKISRGFAIILIYVLSISGISFGGSYFLLNLTKEVRILLNDIPSYGEYITHNMVPKISQSLNTFSKFIPKPPKTEDIENHESQPEPLPIVKKTQNQNGLAQFFSNTTFEVRQGKNGFEIIPHPVTQKQQTSENQDVDLAKMLDDFILDIFKNLQNILLDLLNFGQYLVVSIITSIFQTMITLMVAAFIIIDHERIMDFIRNLFPERFLNYLENFLQKQNVGLNGVIRGQLIISVVNGTLTGIGILLFDIKFALTLSIVATICSLIPIFGVIISSIPIVLMALTSSFWSAVFILAWILGIHFIEGNILNPKIIGTSAKIHPVLVILALMAGETAYGLFGALIAVPLFSILQTTFIFIRENLLDPKPNPGTP
ncbi:MAG: AI-2E family transporter [Deltaproteobacteria bacterium]|nr:AI-2E family transporter [Deltaproteobacteria bacterium]